MTRSNGGRALCLLSVALFLPSAGASRPDISFISSALMQGKVLSMLPAVHSPPTAMSVATGVDPSVLLLLPFRFLAKLWQLLGSAVPERLPSWWTVPEAGEHLLGAASILFSNFFYVHFAIKQFRSRRPFLGCLLLVAAGASIFYHGFQIFHGATACLTHQACYVDTSISLASGLVYVAKCGLPHPLLSVAALGTFFIGPNCEPLYAVSHSAWHFVSAYTAYAMAEGSHQRSLQRALHRPDPMQQLPSPAALSTAVALASPAHVEHKRAHAFNRARTALAMRLESPTAVLQRSAWARWSSTRQLRTQRHSARASSRAEPTASNGGGSPAPVRPLALAVAEAAHAVARALGSAPAAVLGTALGGLAGAAHAARHVLGIFFGGASPSGRDSGERQPIAGASNLLSDLGAVLGGALVALSVSFHGALQSVSNALPRAFRERAGKTWRSSKANMVQLLFWRVSQARSNRRTFSGAVSSVHSPARSISL
ncbi:hypothetical protein T492DRAFT_470035 [Pavlovales sp. CCMP2436]|nr:hypothetical protein T492DRAFT_470035 [Pavlovales sp. CCMP2436]